MYLARLSRKGNKRLSHGIQNWKLSLATRADHVVGVEPEESRSAESTEQHILALIYDK